MNELLSPYYVVNGLFSFSFIFCKLVTPICNCVLKVDQDTDIRAPKPISNGFTGEDLICGELSINEIQILMFLGLVVTIKTRKVASTADLLSTIYLFSKVANGALFFFTNGVACLLYIVLTIIIFFLFPAPTYKGPEKVTYFTGQSFEQMLLANKLDGCYWLIEFFTVASGPCIKMAPHFSQLSGSYSLPNLKFGKVDVHRYPKIAEQFNIKSGWIQNHLPTMILFKDGQSKVRRPAYAEKANRVLHVAPSMQSIVNEFDLNNVYAECKKANSSEVKKTK